MGNVDIIFYCRLWFLYLLRLLLKGMRGVIDIRVMDVVWVRMGQISRRIIGRIIDILVHIFSTGALRRDGQFPNIIHYIKLDCLTNESIVKIPFVLWRDIIFQVVWNRNCLIAIGKHILMTGSGYWYIIVIIIRIGRGNRIVVSGIMIRIRI